MRTSIPIGGINTRDSNRNAPNGSCEEKINLQYRDGAQMPIPYRKEFPSLDISGYTNIVAHKVGDENQINFLGFEAFMGRIVYFAKSVNGVIDNSPNQTVLNGVEDFIDHTINNGVLYYFFISPGNNNQFYQVQFNLNSNDYETTNLYDWKNLEHVIQWNDIPSDADQGVNGSISLRFVFILKTGERVLYSPVYPIFLYSRLTGGGDIDQATDKYSFWTYINFRYFTVLPDDISGVELYATVPTYNTEDKPLGLDDVPSAVRQQLSQELFFLIRFFSSEELTSNDNKVTFYDVVNLDLIDSDYRENLIPFEGIAGGEPLEIDSFTSHSIFGELDSFSGRLAIFDVLTKLFTGYFRSLYFFAGSGSDTVKCVVELSTEDGVVRTPLTEENFNITITGLSGPATIGAIMYPDRRANTIFYNIQGGDIVLQLSSNTLYNYSYASFSSIGIIIDTSNIAMIYVNTNTSISDGNGKLLSENRLQLSAVGQPRFFPVENSYRIGEGTIIQLGQNSIDPENADITAPLLIFTDEGVYSADKDRTGVVLFLGFTKITNLPCISPRILELDTTIIFVSDEGLISINNRQIFNLTKLAFPDQGTGDFPDPNVIYPDFDILARSASVSFNTVTLGDTIYNSPDIIEYIRGAVFAFDSRRGNLWCSNPAYPFSFVYHFETKTWAKSTIVFNEAIDFFSGVSINSKLVYTRSLIRGIPTPGSYEQASNNALVLSGEDLTREVPIHVLTRPAKLSEGGDVKLGIKKCFLRTELFRIDPLPNGVLYTLGTWGMQELNKFKKSILISSIASGVYEDGGNTLVRQDIPYGERPSQYKVVTFQFGCFALPSSYFEYIELEFKDVETRQIR